MDFENRIANTSADIANRLHYACKNEGVTIPPHLMPGLREHIATTIRAAATVPDGKVRVGVEDMTLNVEIDEAVSGSPFHRDAKKAKHYRVPGPYRVVFRQSFMGRLGRMCVGPAHILKGDRDVLGGFSGHEAGRICRALNLEAAESAARDAKGGG